MAYLLDKYWPEHGDILIGGYTKPDFTLSPSFHFHQIGEFKDHPVNRWSDGLIKFLRAVPDDYVLFMMDDYWLNSPVNHALIQDLTDYLLSHGNLARLDVTGDRLGADNWSKAGKIAPDVDLIMSDPQSQYHFSFQAALWRKQYLLDCLAPYESPWQSEIVSGVRLRLNGYFVMGTTKPPMRYTIGVQQGKLALDGGYQTPDYALPQDDAAYIVSQDWIPRELLPEWVY